MLTSMVAIKYLYVMYNAAPARIFCVTRFLLEKGYKKMHMCFHAGIALSKENLQMTHYPLYQKFSALCTRILIILLLLLKHFLARLLLSPQHSTSAAASFFLVLAKSNFLQRLI